MESSVVGYKGFVGGKGSWGRDLWGGGLGKTSGVRFLFLLRQG